MGRRKPKVSFTAWLAKRGCNCTELRYEPDTKTHTACIVVERIMKVPVSVVVTVQDEDTYSGGMTRRHLLLPFKDKDDGSSDAEEAGVGRAPAG